jgi:hypothetical protein
MDWLRLYVDILDDEKIARMSDQTYRIFTYLMLIARERDCNGAIDMTTKDIAWRVRMPENQIRKAIPPLVDLGIISNEDGVLQFVNWSKRQFKSDNVSERVKRFRRKNETLQPTLESRAEQNRTDKSRDIPLIDNSVQNPPPEKDASLKTGKTEEDVPDLSDFNPQQKNQNGTDLKNLVLAISKKNPDAYFNRQVMLWIENHFGRSHPDAVLHCLRSLLKNIDGVKTPKQYLDAAMKIEHGKYNARDHERASEKWKEPGMVGLHDLISQAMERR